MSRGLRLYLTNEHVPADRTSSIEVRTRERLVDDAHTSHRLLVVARRRRVADPEIPSSHQPDPHGVEVGRRHGEEVRRAVFVRQTPRRGHRRSPPVLTQRHPSREGNSLNARHGANPLADVCPHLRRLPARRPRARSAGHVDLEQQQTLGVEPEGPVRQVSQRGREQPGCEDDEQTERHLHADQRAHEPAVSVRVVSDLQRAEWPHRGGAKRWSKAEQHGDRERERDAEAEHAPVGTQHQLHRLLKRQQRHDEGCGPPREDSAGDGRAHGEHRALDEDELNEPSASRANRYTQGHLTAHARRLGRRAGWRRLRRR